DDLVIRRLKFRDELLEQVEKLDDARAQFDQEFGLMTLELSKFIAETIAAFGGTSVDKEIVGAIHEAPPRARNSIKHPSAPHADAAAPNHPHRRDDSNCYCVAAATGALR